MELDSISRCEYKQHKQAAQHKLFESKIPQEQFEKYLGFARNQFAKLETTAFLEAQSQKGSEIARQYEADPFCVVNLKRVVGLSKLLLFRSA